MGPTMYTQNIQTPYSLDAAHSWTGTMSISRNEMKKEESTQVVTMHIYLHDTVCGKRTYMYSTFIEKTACQTQNGGMCPMVT